MSPRNQGQKYEDVIKDILMRRGLLPDNLQGNDAGFIHRGAEYYLEVKNSRAPDFGQRKMVWSQATGWQWKKRDAMSDLYDEIGVMNLIDKGFTPRKYTVAKSRLTEEDLRFDQHQIERSGISLDDATCLYEYCASKECFYIQVEGQSFYYLKRDIARLHVPQFVPELSLRLRAKRHSTKPIHNYSFFVVIQAKRVARSPYDIEEKVGQFPPIVAQLPVAADA